MHPPHEFDDAVHVHCFALVPSIDKSPGAPIMGEPLAIFGSCTGKAACFIDVWEVSEHGQEERRHTREGIIILAIRIPLATTGVHRLSEYTINGLKFSQGSIHSFSFN